MKFANCENCPVCKISNTKPGTKKKVFALFFAFSTFPNFMTKSSSMRVLLAAMILLAVVPATKARPTGQTSVETHSAEREPHRSGAGDGSSSRFYNDLRHNYDLLSPSSSSGLGQCALPTSLDDSCDDDVASSVEEKRRRRHRSASPAASAQETSSQAHTDAESVTTTSEHGDPEPHHHEDVAVCEASSSSFAPSATFLITDMVRFTQFPFRNNYVMRKRGYRVFVGQLYKEVSPMVLSAALTLLFPDWVQGETVDMECHTNPLQPGRGKGCAWVWTATEEMRDALLAVHKEVLIDVHPSGQYLQLAVTAGLLQKLPHLWDMATPMAAAAAPDLSGSASLEALAQQRRREVAVPQSEWLLPNGPMTMEIPKSSRGHAAPSSVAAAGSVQSQNYSSSRAVVVRPTTTTVVQYRHNPYDATHGYTVLLTA